MKKWKQVVSATVLTSSILSASAGYAMAAELTTVNYPQNYASGSPIGMTSNMQVSDDGRFVLFATNTADVLPVISSSPYLQLYIYDRQAGTDEFVCSDAAGVSIAKLSGCYISPRRAMSADSRYVVFTANNKVYVKDRQTGELKGASLDSTGALIEGGNGSISADGQKVVFTKKFKEQIGVDGRGTPKYSYWEEINITDLVTGVGSPIISDIFPGKLGINVTPSLSADGRYVAFKSEIQLTTEPLNSLGSYVYDTVTKSFERIDTNANGCVTDVSGTVVCDTTLEPPSMSSDGRFVSYSIVKRGLDSTGNYIDFPQSFIADRTAKTITRSDFTYLDPSGAQPVGAINPIISADGNNVTFQAFTGRLSSSGSGIMDNFVFERTTGNIARVDASASGELADENYPAYYAVSADASIMVFNSVAANLIPGVTTPNVIYIRNNEGKGYPLSFTVTKAQYDTGTHKLSVEATSSKGAYAGMEALNFGAMTWDSAKNVWTYSGIFETQPASLLVGGIDGYKTVAVVAVTAPPTPVDKVAPVVTSVSPSKNSSSVSTTSSIVASFSESIAKGSGFSSISLKKGNSTTKVSCSISGSKLTIKPSSALSKNATYTVTISANAVIDASGNKFSASYSYSFKTGNK